MSIVTWPYVRRTVRPHHRATTVKSHTVNNLGQNKWKTLTPPPPQINDGKMARFCPRAASSLIWGGWGFAVPFYFVQNCSYCGNLRPAWYCTSIHVVTAVQTAYSPTSFTRPYHRLRRQPKGVIRWQVKSFFDWSQAQLQVVFFAMDIFWKKWETCQLELRL